jgi:hypothetical protein
MMKADLPSLRALLAARTASIYPRILGEPNAALSSRAELRFGRRGSISVMLAGPKTGLWHDFENNCGGDFLTLLMQERRINFSEAVRFATDLIGRSIPTIPVSSRVSQMPAKAPDYALKIWNEASDPHGTIVEAYLAKRRLKLPDDIASSVIRCHHQLGAMIALLRDIKTDQPCGIIRTYFGTDGQKLGRKMLGRAKDAAVKLDADETRHSACTSARAWRRALRPAKPACGRFGLWAVPARSAASPCSAASRR